MKTYIITIIGATLLSAYASNLAPQSWRKYVQIITGLVLIICILSPLKAIVGTDIFGEFDVAELKIAEGKTQSELIAEELSERIETDVEERLIKEFNVQVEAEAEISVNGRGEIEGVKKIRTSGDKLSAAAKARLLEVYGATEVEDE